MPALGTVTLSLAAVGLFYLPIAFLTQHEVPTAQSTVSLIALAVLCTAVAFIVFFALIARVGPVRAPLFTYVNPVVAIVLGVIVLGEEVTLGPADRVPARDPRLLARRHRRHRPRRRAGGRSPADRARLSRRQRSTSTSTTHDTRIAATIASDAPGRGERTARRDVRAGPRPRRREVGHDRQESEHRLGDSARAILGVVVGEDRPRRLHLEDPATRARDQQQIQPNQNGCDGRDQSERGRDDREHEGGDRQRPGGP